MRRLTLLLTLGAASCAADTSVSYECDDCDPGTDPGATIDPVDDDTGVTADVVATTPDASTGEPGEEPGEEPGVEPPPEEEPTEDELVEEEDLSTDESERIAILRDSIDEGLRLGRVLYIDEMNNALQDLGIFRDYDFEVTDPEAGLREEVSLCPFVEFYENGFEGGATSCDYLADLTKVEVYADLSSELDDEPLDVELADSEWGEEAVFWYEQGVISAFEEYRVHVRYDLQSRELCNQNPTPVESSFAKGVTIGRQHFAAAFNMELERRGFAPDYPSITIDICNASEAFVDPAMSNALGTLGMAMEAEPLCAADYEPPDHEASLQYAQAQIDYERGVRVGIEDEFALASVRVFRQVRCNVGDPLVLDMDGDGIELLNIADGVDFDLWSNGRAQAMAWPTADDAFIARDVNGDGIINDGSELFTDTVGGMSDGFEHLAQLDSNQDGAFDANDAAWGEVLVWRDANLDAISQASELQTLAAAGVISVPVTGTAVDTVIEQNPVPFVAQATTVNGTATVADVQLQVAPFPRATLASRHE